VSYALFQDKQFIQSIPKDWCVLSFQDVIQDVTGGNKKIKKEQYLEEGKYPIVDQGKGLVAGYTDEEVYVKHTPPYIIFGDHTRTFKYVDFKFVLGTDGVKVLIPKISEINVKYLYYFFLTLEVPDTGYNRHFKFLKDVMIPIPPLEQQNHIVAVLDKAQVLIDKRKEAIAKLDELVQAVFLDMFGDPVLNKRNWIMKSLGELTDVRDGTHDSPKYVTKGYPLITSKNIKNGKIDFDKVNYISREDFEKINQRSKVDLGDIIMPMIGTIGNPCIVTEEPNYAIKNVALIKFMNNELNNVYVKQLLDSHYLQYILGKNGRGGTQKFLSLSDIRNMKIPVADSRLQEKFCIIEKEIRIKKELYEISIRKLEAYFQTLLQRAFKGELSLNKEMVS
jgi:type I restriction enzyme S subunit